MTAHLKPSQPLAIALVALLAGWFCGLVGAAPQGCPPGGGLKTTPLGGQFQVNVTTGGWQLRPAVAADAEGDFVVTWQSTTSAGSDPAGSVQARRYASDATPLGSEFQVNTSTTNSQATPAVAVGPDGAFVVVWQSAVSGGSDTSGWSIQGQRYAADGTAVGSEFQVNTTTTDFQTYAAVGMAADGRFVVVWQSAGASGSDGSGSIQAQRYAADGTALGGELQVNTYTTGLQARPAVAVAAGGEFVVVWQSAGSSGSDTSLNSIQGRRYAADGTALGGEFQVNTYTTWGQHKPRVATDPAGDFVVVWESRGSSGSDSSSYSIQAQRYASDGTALGGEFQVNTYTTSWQTYPQVAVHAGGELVVVWASDGSGGSDTSAWSIQGQRFAAGGAALGAQFQVNTHTTERQWMPGVAMAPDGGFAVAWASYGSGGSDEDGWSVQGQRFARLADLAITKDDGLTTAVPGQTLTYTIVVSNNGPDDVGAATVTDAFAADLGCSWTSAATGGATGNGAGAGNLSDTLTMPVGSTVTYTVTCLIAPGATGTLVNTATISSALDPVPGNDAATDADTVLVPQADLAVTKTDAPDPVTAGADLTYTIAVTNAGPSDAGSLTVTDALPAGVGFVSASGAGWTCGEAGGVVTCTRPGLTVGAAPAIAVVVTPLSPGTLVNNVAVSAAATDPNGADNVSAAETTVGVQAILAIPTVGVAGLGVMIAALAAAALAVLRRPSA